MLSQQTTISDVLEQTYGTTPYLTVVTQIENAVNRLAANPELASAEIQVILWQNYPHSYQTETTAGALLSTLNEDDTDVTIVREWVSESEPKIAAYL